MKNISYELSNIKASKWDYDYFFNRYSYFIYNYLDNIFKSRYYHDELILRDKNLFKIYFPIWYRDENYFTIKLLIESYIRNINEKYQEHTKKDLKYMQFNDDYFLFMMQNHYFGFDYMLKYSTLIDLENYFKFNKRFIFEYFPKVITEVFDDSEILSFESFNSILMTKKFDNGFTTYERLNNKKFTKRIYLDNNNNKNLKLTIFEMNHIYLIIKNLKYFITDYCSITKLKLPTNKNQDFIYIFDFSPKFWKFIVIEPENKLGKEYLKDFSNLLNIKLKDDAYKKINIKKFSDDSKTNNMLYFNKIFDLNMNTLFFEIFYILKFLKMMNNEILINIWKLKIEYNSKDELINTNFKTFDKHIFRIYNFFPLKFWENLTIEIEFKYKIIFKFFIDLINKNEEDLMENKTIKLCDYYKEKKFNEKVKKLKKENQFDIYSTSHGFILYFREVIEYFINKKLNSIKFIMKNYFVELKNKINFFILEKFKNIKAYGMSLKSLKEIYSLLNASFELCYNIKFMYLGILNLINFKIAFIKSVEEISHHCFSNASFYYKALVASSIADQVYYLQSIFQIEINNSLIYDENKFYGRKKLDLNDIHI